MMKGRVACLGCGHAGPVGESDGPFLHLPNSCLLALFISAKWGRAASAGWGWGPILVRGLTTKTFSSCLALLFKHTTGAGSPAKLPNAAVHFDPWERTLQVGHGPEHRDGPWSEPGGCGGARLGGRALRAALRRLELRAEASHCGEGREP